MYIYHFGMISKKLQHDAAVDEYLSLFICLCGKLFPQHKALLMNMHKQTMAHLNDPWFLEETLLFAKENATPEAKEAFSQAFVRASAEIILEKLGAPKEFFELFDENLKNKNELN